MSTGPVTASEAYLQEVCQRTFLKLWSFANLYRDQKHSKNGTHGKELCDLLVVCGDDVIVFSDKHCEFASDKAIEVAWPRWYRGAVVDSAVQVRGAIRWIREHPHRIFADRSCKRPFPLELPRAPRFHRVVTCRGVADTIEQQFSDDGRLMISNAPLTSSDMLFRVGAIDEGGEVVHVFDERALDDVLQTLDTVTDFCDYLNEREALFRKPFSILAASEGDLLALYLQDLDPATQRHRFAVEEGVTHLSVGEGFWGHWQASRSRQAKEEADRVSYCWDRLIEKFSYHMVTDTQYFTTGGPLSDQEENVRWMARERRVRRRMLASDLLEIMNCGLVPGQMRRRVMMPSEPGDPHWVFLAFRRPIDMAVDEYREARRMLLQALVFVVKHLHSDATDICGIAVEAEQAEMSEDLIYLDAREWTPELASMARDFHEQGELFANAQPIERTVWEFPVQVEAEPTESR